MALPTKVAPQTRGSAETDAQLRIVPSLSALNQILALIVCPASMLPIFQTSSLPSTVPGGSLRT